MPVYVVESYLPRSKAALKQSADRAMRAAAALTAEGVAVRFVRATYLPDEETCFHLFEGPSAGAVGRAAERAALRGVRVVQVVEQTAEPT